MYASLTKQDGLYIMLCHDKMKSWDLLKALTRTAVSEHTLLVAKDHSFVHASGENFDHTGRCSSRLIKVSLDAKPKSFVLPSSGSMFFVQKYNRNNCTYKVLFLRGFCRPLTKLVVLESKFLHCMNKGSG